MAEYIDRIDAIKAVNEQNSLTMTRAALIDKLRAILSADVAEVVRCKNCEYCGKVESGLFCMIHDDMYAGEDYFCADGKRKYGGR